MRERHGALYTSMASSVGKPDHSLAACKRRLRRLLTRRANEVEPGEPWRYDAAIKDAEQKLVAAIHLEQPNDAESELADLRKQVDTLMAERNKAAEERDTALTGTDRQHQ